MQHTHLTHSQLKHSKEETFTKIVIKKRHRKYISTSAEKALLHTQRVSVWAQISMKDILYSADTFA